MSKDILIVDDEADIRSLIQGILEDEGYRTRQAPDAKSAYKEIESKAPDLVVLDIWLENSEHDGLQILENIKEKHPAVPVLMISGHGTIETAVNAIKQGAYDFIEKPFKSGRLLLMIERAIETAKLRQENEALRSKVEGPIEMVGSSTLMNNLRQTMKRVAPTNSRVLITGAPGTGKDIVARIIHRESERADMPFVAVNCATLRPEHLELELFGSELGGVLQIGMLEKANGGTILLDEVADMPLKTQGKIIRVLQEQKFQRVGGQELVEVDVRVVAISNQDLKVLISEGKFREDLYYRLNVVPIKIPTLKERAQDIPELTQFFADMYSKQAGLPKCSFDETTFAAMEAYEWPGNVRQLKNVIEWIMIMGGGSSEDLVKPSQLPPEISTIKQVKGNDVLSHDLVKMPLREAREFFERHYLRSQIDRFEGNVSKTAQFIGMERSALHRKLKQLEINESGDQSDEETDQSYAGRKSA